MERAVGVVGFVCEAGVLKLLGSVVGLELTIAVVIVLDCNEDFDWVACWDVCVE